MKKLTKFAGIFATLLLLFGAAGCSGDSDDNTGGGNTEEKKETSVALTGLSLDTFSASVTVGEDERISINNTYIVTPDFIPSDATNKEFTIKVTDENGSETDVVTVDNDEHSITGAKEGTFILKVISDENAEITATHTFTVKEVALESIKFETASQEVYVGRTATYEPVFTPSDASDKELTWESSNENIATVDGAGKVTGIVASDFADNRTTTITAKSSVSGVSDASYTLTVKNVQPTAISLKKSTFTIQTGGACNIVPVFTPSDTTNQNVTFSASGSSTIDNNGVVTGATEAGTTTITVKSVAKDSLTATATVKVISEDTYIIDDNNVEYGFVSTTGSLRTGDTSRTGYLGSSYLESFSQGATDNIIYSIYSKTEQDVKVLLHYAFWGGNGATVRGAYIVVNGATDEDIIYLNYTAKSQTLDENGNVTKSDNVKEFDTDGKTPKSYHAIWEDSNEITVHLDAGENQIRVVAVPKGTSMPNATYRVAEQQDSNGSYTEPKSFEPTGNDDKKAEGYLANIDYIQITGSGLGCGSNSLVFYKVTSSADHGTVTLEPAQDFYKGGANVTLKVADDSGYSFNAWSGRTSSGDFFASNNAEYTFKIEDDITVSAHSIPTAYTKPAELVGYAAITDDAGTNYTITGGAGGSVITIASLSDLTSKATQLSSNTPYIVRFTSGSRICTSDNKSIIVNIGSNKTIYGATSGAGLKNIELRVEGENVIIQNLILGEVIAYDTLPAYKGEGNDALSLNGARHVWVDHCEIRSNTTPKDIEGNTVTNPGDSDFEKDWYDGLLDIKNGATWITVSNCYFHDHYKACLCGSGDDGPDTNKEGYSDSDMRVTFANNYWHNVNARQPLFRYGKAHIYGSYFDAGTFSGGASFINCRAGSELYIEGNTFKGTKSDSYTIGFYYADSSKKYGNTSGSWVSKNNSGVSSKNGTSYVPPYTVTVGSAPSSVPSGAGATLTSLSYN